MEPIAGSSPITKNRSIGERNEKTISHRIFLPLSIPAGSEELDVPRGVYRPRQKGHRRILHVSGSLEHTYAGVPGAICDRRRVLLHRGESRAAAALPRRR